MTAREQRNDGKTNLMTMSARVLGAGGALLGLLVYAGWPAPAVGTQRPDYDVVITNGLVLDGSGQAAGSRRRGDS